MRTLTALLLALTATTATAEMTVIDLPDSVYGVAIVTDVLDGDTLELQVTSDETQDRVRAYQTSQGMTDAMSNGSFIVELAGVETPELSYPNPNPRAYWAKYQADQQFLGEQVNFYCARVDSAIALSCHIVSIKKDLSKSLLQLGLADYTPETVVKDQFATIYQDMHNYRKDSTVVLPRVPVTQPLNKLPRITVMGAPIIL